MKIFLSFFCFCDIILFGWDGGESNEQFPTKSSLIYGIFFCDRKKKKRRKIIKVVLRERGRY